MSKTTEWYQQGDVIIEPAAELPSGAKKMPISAQGAVLIKSPVTNHAHVVDKAGRVTLVEKDGTLYFKNQRRAALTHEEHKTIMVPAGTWRVRGVREYDHFVEEARRVID